MQSAQGQASKRDHDGELRRCVLVVDDEEPNRVLMSALLTAHGFETRVASDGPSALQELAQGDIALMLLDVMMPGMDGLEVCKRVRQELGEQELIIVFLTALSDRDSRLRAKLAGADDFLVKPVEGFELSFRVQNWFRLRELSRHNEQLTQKLAVYRTVAREAQSSLRELAESHAAQLPPNERARLQETIQRLSRTSEDA